MVLRRFVAGIVALQLSLGPPASGVADVLPDSTLSAEPILLCSYPGNHGFIHETGAHVPNGWAAQYRVDLPGYFVRGRVNGGEPLETGTYQYIFYLSMPPGQLGGLLKRATDVVRLEAWDRTANERLLFRTLQVADFPTAGRRLYRKSVIFSSFGRAGHAFEPRIFWSGFASLFLERVELRRLTTAAPDYLAKKADAFETLMGDEFLDRGLVVGRDLQGNPEELGDSAIWTGLYAAAEGWRYQATGSKEALVRMEASLRALHELVAAAPAPGTLVRYVDATGRILPDPASKDSYTGFFFAIANALPLVHDRGLRRDLLKDTESLAGHFLDHDLAFVPPKGAAVQLNPYPSQAVLDEGLNELAESARERRGLIRLLRAVDLYFLSHGQRPWPEQSQLVSALKRNDVRYVRTNLIPVLNGTLRALGQLQRNVQRSDEAYRLFLTRTHGPSVTFPEAPYGKLNDLLVRVLSNLSRRIDGPALDQVSDAKVLPSQALHALHFVKVAGEALPKPNRFDDFYRANLWENKMLLKTVLDWHSIDEEALTAVFGHSRAAVMRSASGHLPYLALYDLVKLERDAGTRGHYRDLFESEYLSVQEDYNAMVHFMRGALGMKPDQVGIGLWSLALYPADRRGLGERYWRKHHKEWAARYGGALLNQARDPVSVDQRQRDCFIWQRSARSIGGDSDQKIYPPMDYLFVYWMARASKLVSGEERPAWRLFQKSSG